MGGDTLMNKIPENPMGNYAKNLDRYKFVDGEWWYYYPETGTSVSSGNHTRERASTLRKRFDQAMYVNGKYIPKSHPLHKPGRYKSFEDAAFSSLEKYESSTEGQVYVIVNPNFPEWVKVGMAVDAADRLNGYQTSSPFRDYVLNYSWDVNDRRAAESEAHSELQKLYERRSEWFKCTPEQAQEVVSGIVGSYQ
jgi:hypothetical protein